jgi:hypothetical protein
MIASPEGQAGRAGPESGRDAMRITVHTEDGLDPMDCPHQFVGRCEKCAAQAGPVDPAEMTADRVTGTGWFGTGGLTG